MLRRISVFFLLCAILVLTAPASAGKEEAPQDFKSFFSDGNQAMDEGRWNDALESLAKAEEIAGTDKNGRSPAANCQGLVHMKSRQWKEAVPHFERAVNYNPENKVALNNLGLTLMNIHQYGLGDLDNLKRAAESYEKLAALDPDYRAANRELVKKILIEAEALAAKTKAASDDKDLPEGKGYKFWTGQGDEAEGNGQFEKAMKCYAKAEEQSASSKHWAANRQGLCAMKQRDFAGAANQLERATSLVAEPTSKEAIIFNNLGTAYINIYESGTGNLPELENAAKAFKRASELNADDGRFSANLASAEKRIEQEKTWTKTDGEKKKKKKKK